MSSLVVLVVVLVVVGVLVVALKVKSRGGSDDGPWPFYAKKPLSVPEQIFYFRLLKAFPDHIVLAQVGLSRLLGVKKGNNFQAWNNRINRMSADFVLCTKDSSVVAVIELDDATHAKEDRKIADAKKEKALSFAGIRVLRWQAKSLPDETALTSAVGAQQSVPGDAPASRGRP